MVCKFNREGRNESLKDKTIQILTKDRGKLSGKERLKLNSDQIVCLFVLNVTAVKSSDNNNIFYFADYRPFSVSARLLSFTVFVS